MHEHEVFEELCALAVAGQISATEWSLLRAHLCACDSCQELLRSFGEIGAEILTQELNLPSELELSDLKSRFFERAEDEGLKITPTLYAPRRWSLAFLRPNVYAIAAATAALLLLVGIVKFQSHSASVNAYKSGTPNPPVSTTTGKQHATGEVNRTGDKPDLAEVSRLKQQLDSLRIQLRASDLHAQELQSRLSQLSIASDEQRKQLEARTSAIANLRAERDNTAANLAETLVQNEKAKLNGVAANIQIAAQQSQLNELTEHLARERANFEREKVLAAAGNDGQFIIAARNLHIIDVYDSDERGKRQKAFGRVFYVEGRELVFYAYDLADPKHRNTHFYAWGAGDDGSHFIARLGVFHNDGNGEGRWVLRFGDAGVLAKVDSVFVTAEQVDVTKPKGKRVLFAVLSGQPNHS